MFHTLFATPDAGAGTDLWLRLTGWPLQPEQPSSNGRPASEWLVRDNGGKLYSALVAETCQCSGHGETRLLPRSCVCSRLFRRLTASTSQKPSSSNRVAYLHLGVQ